MENGGSTPLESEQRETSVGLEDHVSESVLTIAGRIRQTAFTFPVNLCNHTILAAWCIVNVDGFADSEARVRIPNAVRAPFPCLTYADLPPFLGTQKHMRRSSPAPHRSKT